MSIRRKTSSKKNLVSSINSNSVKSNATTINTSSSCRSNVTQNTSLKSNVTTNSSMNVKLNLERVNSDYQNNGTGNNLNTVSNPHPTPVKNRILPVNSNSKVKSPEKVQFNSYSVRTTNKSQQKEATKRRNQVLSMTILVTCGFLICWFFQQLSNFLFILPGIEQYLGSPKNMNLGEDNSENSDELEESKYFKKHLMQNDARFCSACQQIKMQAYSQRAAKLNLMQAQNLTEIDILRNQLEQERLRQEQEELVSLAYDNLPTQQNLPPKTSFIYIYNEYWRLFSYINSCINPIVYFSISKTFQNNLLEVLGIRKAQKMSRRIRNRFRKRNQEMDRDNTLSERKEEGDKILKR